MEDIIGIPKIERTKLSFERFVATGPAKRIAFVGTERALRDAESTFKRSSQSTLSLVPSVANFQQFQATISNLVPSFDALCFLRGGGDPASFVIWNDSRLISYLVELRLPFYTALGHSTDFTLADKYADESFVTPSDLGAAYSNALQARNQREVMQRDLDQARNERNELQLQKDSLSNSFSEIHGLHSARSKRTTTLLLVLLILLAAAVAALVFR
jgi:exodeoxyribonuclease VII large subunit